MRAAVDFPLPLSPTRPRFSPSLSEKEIPSTARMGGATFPNYGLLGGKIFLRSFTSRKELGIIILNLGQDGSCIDDLA